MWLDLDSPNQLACPSVLRLSHLIGTLVVFGMTQPRHFMVACNNLAKQATYYAVYHALLKMTSIFMLT